MACPGHVCSNKSDPQYQAAIAAIATQRPKNAGKTIQQELYAVGGGCWLSASNEEAVCELLNIWGKSDPVAEARSNGWLTDSGGGSGSSGDPCASLRTGNESVDRITCWVMKNPELAFGAVALLILLKRS